MAIPLIIIYNGFNGRGHKLSYDITWILIIWLVFMLITSKTIEVLIGNRLEKNERNL